MSSDLPSDWCWPGPLIGRDSVVPPPARGLCRERDVSARVDLSSASVMRLGGSPGRRPQRSDTPARSFALQAVQGNACPPDDAAADGRSSCVSDFPVRWLRLPRMGRAERTIGAMLPRGSGGDANFL